MTVSITNALKLALDNEDAANLLCTEFLKWKGMGEYEHYHFGKDSFYVTPLVNNEKYILRHVHLIPQTDERQLLKWAKAFKNRGRKTSDRVLIYAQSADKYLLIYILSEPDAHKIATMKNQVDKELMESFAKVADAFICDGSVII